jgi:hypothetical protein
VRDEQHRLPGAFPDAKELVLQDYLRLLVQGRERLVHEQDLRVVGEGPGHGHPLLHAT